MARHGGKGSSSFGWAKSGAVVCGLCSLYLTYTLVSLVPTSPDHISALPATAVWPRSMSTRTSGSLEAQPIMTSGGPPGLGSFVWTGSAGTFRMRTNDLMIEFMSVRHRSSEKCPRSDVDGEKHLQPTPPTERKIFCPLQMRMPTSAAMQVAVEPEQRCERNLFLPSSDLNANMKDAQYRQGLTTDEVIRLEQEMQVLPRTRSASASSSSSPLLRPAATGAERYKTPAMPSSFKFSWKYDIDWSAIEVERYPIHDQMKLFIQALASSAKFKIHGGVLLEHNPAWDRGTDATEESMRRYYYLVSSDLALKEPPLPTKAERILFWSHATDVGSLWSMLRNRDMLPMSAHGVASFGCNIFYALGHEVCGGEEDEYNIARVLYNTTKSAKNLASVVVGGKAWGSLRKVYGGSVETARVATEEDEVLKDSNAKAYCVSRNRYSFNYIAFEQLAQPPSTTRGLINQYIRAANLKPPGRQALL
ncbi:hypothetical protein AK812_SmicGene12428 [Symbiodinium microadriaticum]|uniref:Uncharacterized protein n=1 Tax=Symbiodinium microadriaticum TaxID=2951 RepID=A0A1Q9EAN4_SYMMI|nr:hypothetical protein AK812_SmicGene12428 [Symbiodinium microadriaticum]